MVEGFKWDLMGCPNKNMEDIVTESDLKCAHLDQAASVENFSMWPTDCFCSILVKNMAAFCPCPKSLPGFKMKRFRLIALKKEVSKQPGVNSVVWLLKLTLVKNILMKRSKLRKERYKIYGLSIKGTPGSEIELNSVFKILN